MLRASLAIFLCLLVVSGPDPLLPTAHADERASDAATPTRVAVVPVTIINASLEQVDTYTDALRRALQQSLAIDVIERAEMDAALIAPVPSDCTRTRDCITSIGKALNAQELLFVDIGLIGNRCQIESTWVDVVSGQTEKRDRLLLTSDADLEPFFAAHAAQLLPHALPAPTVVEPEPTVVEPEPTVVEPEPTVVEPEPASTQPLPQPATAALQPISPTPNPGRRLTTGVWIAGGISLLAAASGSVFGVQALATQRDLRTKRDGGQCGRPICTVDPGQRDDLARQRDLTDLMFATAITASIVAGILYWRSTPDPATVEISAAPTQGQIRIMVRF